MPPTTGDPARPPESATAGPLSCPASSEADGDGLVQVTPRALAGPGEPAAAMEVLRQAGWRVHDDELANTHAWSPDGLVYVGFLPEGDAGQPHHIDDADGGASADWAASAVAPTRRVLWQVRAYRHPNAARPVWTATFDEATPAELVATFLAATADPAPLTRDPLDPAGMLDHPSTQPDTAMSP